MTKMPPVPPANRSTKGIGSEPDVSPQVKKPGRRENLAEQGRQGNIKTALLELFEPACLKS